MASVVSEPAPKRRKLSTPTTYDPTHVENTTASKTISESHNMARSAMGSQLNREAQAGILCFVNESNPGFSGILKQRYTDFLVNEVTIDGTVVHLTDINAPRRKAVNRSPDRKPSPAAEEDAKPTDPTAVQADWTLKPVVQPNLAVDTSSVVSQDTANGQCAINFSMSAGDKSLLDYYFGVDVRELILKLHDKALQNPQAKPASIGSVTSEPITDRQLRTQLHKDMRRIFNSQLETASDAHGVIKITVAQKSKPYGRYGQESHSGENSRINQARGNLTWQELGGQYLHFTLYKENKDTMEVISYISSQLRTSPRQFAFAGTKDRRAVTVQRISVYRIHAEQLVKLNKTLHGSKVGNFQHGRHSLELGELMGNEFVITLRDCSFTGSEIVKGEEKVALADKVVGAAVKNMQDHGFINYYGLQRFGTYAIGTEEVGKRILQGDFEGAVNAVLTYADDALSSALDPGFTPADGKPLPRDDISRAHALHLFKTTGKSQPALEKLPRKFSGESSIIKYLNRNGKDFVGALLQIPRNLRLMYIHAYQSLVWNMVASQRWARYGDKVMKGDLVLVDSEAVHGVLENEVDENGEIIVLPAANDVAVSHDDLYQRARPLTAEEADGGEYNIFDIVLPTPGYDIEYPDNDIGDYYKEFMMSERGGGLDPGNMRRAQKDFSLSGSYRKFLAQIGNDMSYEVKLYSNDNEQMVETDLEKITKSRQNFGDRGPDHRARENHRGLPEDPKWMQQRKAWKDLPSELAREEKAAMEAFGAQKETDIPKVEVAQPAYQETFIQTSAEHGKRTGHREITVMPGVSVDILEASDENKTYEDIELGGQMDGTTESKPYRSSKRSEPAPPRVMTPAKAAPPFTFGMITDKALSNIEYGFEAEASASIEDKIDGSATELPHNTAEMEIDNHSTAHEVSQKIAVIVKFKLGSSQYATMALRELMKQGGMQAYKPDFSSGR